MESAKEELLCPRCLSPLRVCKKTDAILQSPPDTILVLQRIWQKRRRCSGSREIKQDKKPSSHITQTTTTAKSRDNNIKPLEVFFIAAAYLCDYMLKILKYMGIETDTAAGNLEIEYG